MYAGTMRANTFVPSGRSKTKRMKKTWKDAAHLNSISTQCYAGRHAYGHLFLCLSCLYFDKYLSIKSPSTLSLMRLNYVHPVNKFHDKIESLCGQKAMVPSVP